MFFRICIACIALAACYAIYEIVKVRNYWHFLQTPPADFLILQKGNGEGPTIVEFMNYDCEYCKDTHLLMMDYAAKNPNVRLIVRPVPYAVGDAEMAAEMLLAAGLQGKFADMDKAFTAYKYSLRGPLAEKFFRETAALYDVDFDKMMREAEEEKVQEMAKNNASASIRANLKITPAFMINKTIYQQDRPLTLSDLTSMVRQENNR